MKVKTGARTCFCPFCHRRRIVVNNLTGLREPHFRKQGRKGGRCKGSGLDTASRPEARA